MLGTSAGLALTFRVCKVLSFVAVVGTVSSRPFSGH